MTEEFREGFYRAVMVQTIVVILLAVAAAMVYGAIVGWRNRREGRIVDATGAMLAAVDKLRANVYLCVECRERRRAHEPLRHLDNGACAEHFMERARAEAVRLSRAGFAEEGE